jgi:hypothetical protein
MTKITEWCWRHEQKCVFEKRTRGESAASAGEHVHASGSATVRASGAAVVHASDSAVVYASGAAVVHASGLAVVYASGAATVHAYGSATVRASGAAVVHASDLAVVYAYGSATVHAYGSATVHAYGSATVHACGAATVHAYGSATVRAYGGFVAVIVRSRAATVYGGKQIDMTRQDTNVERWALACNVRRTEDGALILYKRVRANFETQNGIRYEPDTEVIAPDWDGGADECGAGLHFCPAAWQCDEFAEENLASDRYLACAVKPEDIVIHERPVFPSKIKARACRVLYECDQDGNALPPAPAPSPAPSGCLCI